MKGCAQVGRACLGDASSNPAAHTAYGNTRVVRSVVSQLELTLVLRGVVASSRTIHFEPRVALEVLHEKRQPALVPRVRLRYDESVAGLILLRVPRFRWRAQWVYQPGRGEHVTFTAGPTPAASLSQVLHGSCSWQCSPGGWRGLQNSLSVSTENSLPAISTLSSLLPSYSRRWLKVGGRQF